MTQSKLTKRVAESIECYFKEFGKTIIYSNELHLQMHLAQFLERNNYQLLYEYKVPSEHLSGVDEKDSYPWRKSNGSPQDMYLDLVVFEKDEYVPIEIKYKTRSLNTSPSVFNRTECDVEWLRDQGAQDLGMYGFWKDVHWLEMVRGTYSAVKNGIAIFVTNDPYYIKNNPKSDVSHFDFRMTDNREITKPIILKWKKSGSKIAKEHPAFRLNVDNEYRLNWHNIGSHSNPREREDFSYCMLII